MVRFGEKRRSLASPFLLLNISILTLIGQHYFVNNLHWQKKYIDNIS